MNCQNCGKKLEKEFKNCPECGEQFRHYKIIDKRQKEDTSISDVYKSNSNSSKITFYEKLFGHVKINLKNIFYFLLIVLNIFFILDWMINYQFGIDALISNNPTPSDPTYITKNYLFYDLISDNQISHFIFISRVVIGFIGYLITVYGFLKFVEFEGILTAYIVLTIGNIVAVVIGFLAGFLGPFILIIAYNNVKRF